METGVQPISCAAAPFSRIASIFSLSLLHFPVDSPLLAAAALALFTYRTRFDDSIIIITYQSAG